MTIRFLNSAGLMVEVYAVEVAGLCYSVGEVERIITGHVSEGQADQFCMPAQKDCAAVEQGCLCGLRTYAGRPYCPKHWQRYLRTGDPTVARKRGPKKKGNPHV